MAARTSKIQQAACERVLRDGMGGERGRSTAARTASEAGTGGAGERGLRGRGRRAGPVHGLGRRVAVGKGGMAPRPWKLLVSSQRQNERFFVPRS
jgi:hypothetical protein